MFDAESKKKYEDFLKKDINNNRGLIVNQYDQIEFIMNNSPRFLIQSNLDDILEYATHYVPYYKKYKEYKSIVDFPIIDKNTIRDNYTYFQSLEYCQDGNNEIKSTSGSTGVPFSIIFDRKKHARYIADLKWYATLAGCVSHERMVYLHNEHHTYEHSIEIQNRDNFYNLGYTYCDSESINNLLYKVQEICPYGIIGYTSLFDAMADYILKNKIKRYNIPLKFIVITSERLSKKTKDVVAQFFNCPVFSRYGSEETGVMAQEDDTINGFRFNEASFYLEVLNLDNDEPVENGETGRIVITDLYNKAMPLIRYDTGDLGEKNFLSNGQIYLRDIWGRRLDSIYTTDGKLVPGGEATDFLESIMDIKQFQLIQETCNEYTCFLNSTNHSYEEMIIHNLKTMLGKNAIVSIKYVNEIPILKSGKQLKTICKIKR